MQPTHTQAVFSSLPPWTTSYAGTGRKTKPPPRTPPCCNNSPHPYASSLKADKACTARSSNAGPPQNPTMSRPRPTRYPRYTTSTPRTDAGKAIYALALALTKVRAQTRPRHGLPTCTNTNSSTMTSSTKKPCSLNCSLLVGLSNQFPISGEYCFEGTKFFESIAARAAC